MAEWEVYLDLVPVEYRHRLDHEIEESDSLATGVDWKRVANFLPGIDKQYIAVVEHDESSLDYHRFTILRKWKEGNRHLATYRRLAQALFDAGAVDSVHALCQELGAPQNELAHPTPSSTAEHGCQHLQAIPYDIQHTISSTPSSEVTELTASSTMRDMRGSDSISPRAREIAEIASIAASLQDMFVTIILHTKIYFMEKEAKSRTFSKQFQIMLFHLPLSNKYKHLHFLREDIKMVKDIEEIWDILDPHWDWRDYALLEWIIKEFGTSELQKEMKEYIEELEQFEKTTSVKYYN